MKKKICIMVPSLCKGGAEEIVVELYNSLEGKFDAKLLLVQRVVEDSYNYGRLKNKKNVHSIFKKMYKVNSIQAKFQRMLIFIFNPIIVLILHFKYKVLFDDYIHLNLSSTKILAVWFKIFKVLSKRKYIIVETFHTNWILLNRKDRIINRIAWIFIDIIICELGDDERDILKKIMPKKDIRFIPFAIRIDNKISYEKREFEFEKNEILIISIARIVNRIKRFDISLKAVSLLENKYKYIIAGDGQDKKLIEKYINKLGLSDRAIIIGYVDNPIKYINMSNIVIAAMIGSYPGLAGLQAGISGKALIGIQINKDYYGEKDIIWSSNDPHKIALKIQSLENTAEYEKYTRNVKDFLLERHSLENFHREYNNIFLGLQ